MQLLAGVLFISAYWFMFAQHQGLSTWGRHIGIHTGPDGKTDSVRGSLYFRYPRTEWGCDHLTLITPPCCMQLEELCSVSRVPPVACSVPPCRVIGTLRRIMNPFARHTPQTRLVHVWTGYLALVCWLTQIAGGLAKFSNLPQKSVRWHGTLATVVFSLTCAAPTLASFITLRHPEGMQWV